MRRIEGGSLPRSETLRRLARAHGLDLSQYLARLAAAAKEHGDADLIIAGTESSDGYTGTVPEQMAEVLGLPSITFAKSVAVEGGTVKVARQTEAGYDEVTCPTPAVVSVTAGVVEPRYPTFKGIMEAKKKPVETLGIGDLGIDTTIEQTVAGITAAPERAAGEKIEDEGEAYLRIVEKLEEAKVI